VCWVTAVELRVTVWDETNTRIKPAHISRRIQRTGGCGLVGLVGVQTNQFRRAVDIARPLRAAGISVCIGGFHVSGCIAMLPALPPELREAMALGIVLFAGEVEGRLDAQHQPRFAQGGQERSESDHRISHHAAGMAPRRRTHLCRLYSRVPWRYATPDIDIAMTPVQQTQFEALEMYSATRGAKSQVERQQRRFAGRVEAAEAERG